jgi:hypothetical protein
VRYLSKNTVLESSISSTYDLTHNLPKPFASEVLRKEYQLSWHLVVLAFKLSYSSLALEGVKGGSITNSGVPTGVCVLLDECLFSNSNHSLPFYLSLPLYGHIGTYFLSIPHGRGCQHDFIQRAPT